jgi:hypothetical protein
MLVSSPHSLHGVLRRPVVRMLLFFLALFILFVVLLPNSDEYHLLENVAQHQRHRPHLHSSHFISPHPEQPSRLRIKSQRPLAEPGHDGPWAERANAVRGAFLHAYQGYLTHAAPHDELRPVSKVPVDKCVCPHLAWEPLTLIDTVPCAASAAGVSLSSILSTRCGSWACTMSLMPDSPSWLT